MVGRLSSEEDNATMTGSSGGANRNADGRRDGDDDYKDDYSIRRSVKRTRKLNKAMDDQTRSQSVNITDEEELETRYHIITKYYIVLVSNIFPSQNHF